MTQFGVFHSKWSYSELTPRCESCDTPFFLKNIIVKEESELKCNKCGLKTNIVPAPEWLKKSLPSVDYLVNAQMDDDLEGKEPVISGGIALTCPQCNGSLIIDGKDRLVPCQYCSVNIYLPDDLWLRLHPVSVKKRWFLVYDKNEVEKINFDE